MDVYQTSGLFELAKKRPKPKDDEESPREWPRARSIALVGFFTILSLAIIGNATILQPAKSIRQQVAAEDEDRPDLVPDSARANTIIIKYDPAVEEIQRELLGLGAYTGLVDGIYGERTKAAIIAYQSANDLDQTGVATPDLLEHIRYRRTLAAAAEYTATAEQAPKPRIKTDEHLRRVESALYDLGYDPGDIDGNLTPETKAAIRKFESDRKLPASGQLNSAVLAELAKTTGYEDIAAQ